MLRVDVKDKESGEIVRDLDAIVGKSIFFRLHGKMREIKPITTEAYLIYVNSLSLLYSMKDKDGLTTDELLNSYYSLVKSVCDDFTMDDIKQMSQQQIGALFQLILDTITGTAHADVEKKSLLMRMT